MKSNPNYKTSCLESSKEHKDVKSIPGLLDRDASFQNQSKGRKAPEWVDLEPKFHSLHVEKMYDTDIIRDDWRPIRSIQDNQRKIIFTIDDKHVFYDIRGDNRLIFLEWGDDLEGLVHRDYMMKHINQFRE